MKKTMSTVVICIGVLLIIIGFCLRVPPKELTTYSSLKDKSTIEEYVGGDAYNYIIGASLIGGEIAGAKTQKAIFICVGSLIVCIGLLYLSKKNEDNAEDTLANNSNTIQSDKIVTEGTVPSYTNEELPEI